MGSGGGEGHGVGERAIDIELGGGGVDLIGVYGVSVYVAMI